MRLRNLLASVVILMVCLLSPGLAISDEIEDLVRNGDFEENVDLAQWGFDGKNSVATMTIDKKDSAVGDSSLFVEILALDPGAGWVPNIQQQGHILVKGITYTYSAFLKAEDPKNITLDVKQNGAPWQSYKSESFSVGIEWTEYWLTFEAQQDAPAMVLELQNTNSLINHWIDGVRFYEGEYEPTIPGQEQAVTPGGKLPATWAAIRVQY
ncbi:carbohydrate binding domain-containing protein [Candidatus Poribacteria bacterium]